MARQNAKESQQQTHLSLDFFLSEPQIAESIAAIVEEQVSRINGDRADANAMLLSQPTTEPSKVHYRVSLPATAAQSPPSVVREVFFQVLPPDEVPTRKDPITGAAEVLGANVIQCRSLQELSSNLRSQLTDFVAAADASQTGRKPRGRLGIIWMLSSLTLCYLAVGPWLRYWSIDFQLPPLDWRVIAEREPEDVLIWVPPIIGPALILFLVYTLWRVRRLRRIGSKSTDQGLGRPALVMSLVLFPFVTNAVFTFLFFQKGRIYEVRTEVIHSRGFGMLTTYYPLSEFDLEEDQFRYLRPRYKGSKNILPFWQPWLFAAIFLASALLLALLLGSAKRRRVLTAGWDGNLQREPPGR